MSIKLNLLFLAMDLLTLMAYPIVFMHGRLLQSLKPQEGNIAPKVFAVMAS